jgi:hypothetical protein
MQATLIKKNVINPSCFPVTIMSIYMLKKGHILKVYLVLIQEYPRRSNRYVTKVVVLCTYQEVSYPYMFCMVVDHLTSSSYANSVSGRLEAACIMFLHKARR